MDALEMQVRRENQNQTRLRVLAHLQAAVREMRGCHRLELKLEGDIVTIVYSDGSTKRVNIACDSELAMILDVVQKMM